MKDEENELFRNSAQPLLEEMWSHLEEMAYHSKFEESWHERCETTLRMYTNFFGEDKDEQQ